MKKLLSLITALLVAIPLSATALTVQPGDTLSQIAKDNGTTVEALVEANGIADPNRIYVGQEIQTDGLLGAAIPTVVATYVDSLASRISNVATSFTLTRGTDRQGRQLSGFYGFTLDEGTPSEEFVTANCATQVCTFVNRGIDVVDGKTSVLSLQFEHRRGSTAKISNFPQLAILSRILNGQESASSTFMIGDGNTVSSTNKTIFIDNGTTNKPFVRYNEATHRWQFSDDGISTVSFATSSGNGLSASTTKSVFVTDSLIGVNVSSSRGILQSTGGGIYSGYIYLNASTTQGLTFNAVTGELMFNPASNVVLTGNWSTTYAPVSGNDLVNKTYADSGFFIDYGTGADGDVTVSVTTTLSRDMFYNNLILNNSINSAGYRIYVKGTLTRNNSAKIFNSSTGIGGNGGNGSGSSGGAAGAAGATTTAGSMPGGVGGVPGVAGFGAGASTQGVGLPGNSGIAQTSVIINTVGANGGNGGTVNATAGGTGGSGGTVTQTNALPYSFVASRNLFEYGSGSLVLLKPTGQSASGGSGAAGAGGGSTAAGGGSGGSGASGGMVWVAARFIVVNGAAVVFESKGAAGGAGGNGVAAGSQGAGGGGGGGAGGNGGVIWLRYASVTGSIVTDVTGGAGGAAGTGFAFGGSTLGTLPTVGATGNSGQVITL